MVKNNPVKNSSSGRIIFGFLMSRGFPSHFCKISYNIMKFHFLSKKYKILIILIKMNKYIFLFHFRLKILLLNINKDFLILFYFKILFDLIYIFF